MIFVTVGTQLPFDRLVRGADAWAAAHPNQRVVAQTGHLGAHDYKPRHMDSRATFAPAEFDRLCAEADLIVAHAGTGSLLKAQASRKPILMMPRRAALGEHRNDHQQATVNALRDRTGITVVFEEEALPTAIDAVRAGGMEPPVLNDFADAELIAALRAVIFPR